MVMIGVLLALAASWFFLQAVPRARGALRGWRGVVLGGGAAALAVWSTRQAGAGPAVAVAQVLAVVMLAVPVMSYAQARRRAAGRRAA